MELPAVELLLTPQLDNSKDVSGLSCILSFDLPEIQPGCPIVEIPIKNGPSPSQDYTDLDASDTIGHLPLVRSEHSGNFLWTSSRATAGRITLKFHAYPRSVGPQTPIGPRVDMRRDHGGIGVSGISFLPLPTTMTDYGITIKWDLTDTQVSAAWSFHDGPGPHHVVGTFNILRDTYFAAGQLKRMGNDDFGLYWFGDLPATISDSASWNEQLFKYLVTLFNDPNATYRIFVRNASPARGFGGTAFRYSYCLEYDDSLPTIATSDIKQLLAHETIHNWPMIGKLSDNDNTVPIFDWYNEGIANYYSIIAPHAAGLLSDAEYIDQINEMLTAYYTNHYVHKSNKDAADDRWDDIFALELPYIRGFAYLLRVSGQIGTAEFDKIINELVRKKMSGTICTEQDWLDHLEPTLGAQAKQDFDDMSSGKLVLPRRALTGYSLVRKDKLQIEIGMKQESLDKRKVIGLDLASRAAKAGIKEGDQIISNGFVWALEAHYDANLVFKIRRGETEHVIEYWPRGWEEVEAWEFVKS